MTNINRSEHLMNTLTVVFFKISYFSAINQDDPKNEKKIVFASCGELIFSKVLEKIDNMGKHPLSPFSFFLPFICVSRFNFEHI